MWWGASESSPQNLQVLSKPSFLMLSDSTMKRSKSRYCLHTIFGEVNQCLRSCSVKVAKEIIGLLQFCKNLPVCCFNFFFSFIKFFLDVMRMQGRRMVLARSVALMSLFVPEDLHVHSPLLRCATEPRRGLPFCFFLDHSIIKLMLDELSAFMAGWLSEKIAISFFSLLFTA